MAKPKNLHLATCLKDLSDLVVIRNDVLKTKSIHLLINAAKKVLITAGERRLERDEELEYIMYMKYFGLLTEIRKKPDYQENKTIVRKTLGTTNQNKDLMDRLEALTDSLTARYAQLQQQLKPKVQVPVNESLSVATPVVEQKSAVAAAVEQKNLALINCRELFEHLHFKNILIMDCRRSADYDLSHMTYSWALNVPEELIAPGMSAGKLQAKLNADVKSLWAARIVKDRVVLMDWNTKDAPPPPNTPIATLLDILENWDPDATYRAPIQILEGGYEYFILMYPTLCTNPIVQAPQDNENELDPLDDIEYPSIHDITMKDEVRERDFALAAENYPDTVVKQRPHVDRVSKIVAMRTYDEKQNFLKELRQDEKKLEVKASNLNELLINALEKWHTLMNQQRNGIDISAAKQELLFDILQLESGTHDYQTEKQRLRAEVARLMQQNNRLISAEYDSLKEIESHLQYSEKHDNDHATALQQLLDEFKGIDIISPAPTMVASIDEDPLASSSPITFDYNNRDRDEHEQLAMSTMASSTKPNIHYDDDKENELSAAAISRLPQFDRTTKPHALIMKYNIPIPSRMRDFSPVRGPNLGRGLTGLKNLGNTCYMNSILQCLSNTPSLTEYCISDKYQNYINRNNKTQGQIVEELAALLKVIWNGNYKCVASRDLHQVIGQYQSMFRNFDQQDSHEFLTILMDWLHSDLQTLSTQTHLRQNINAATKAWNEFTNNKESLILHLFYGQLKSTVKCVTCNKESATYESFSNLSLELPQDSKQCFLEQCLDMYFSGEEIHGWNCPTCKQKRDAIKKLDICKLPPVLVVHVKRFYADTDSLGSTYKKNQNYLRFPIDDLDMTPYITKSESRKNIPKSYQLYSVSNHYGTMESGHYTAVCKNTNYGRWYKFDDQLVTAMDTSSVLSSAAYILFYTRLAPIQIQDFC